MTTVPLPTDEARLALSVATAAAQVLPSPEPLTPAAAQPGTPDVVRGYAGAVIAELEGQLSGRVAVLVGDELVQALESSPLGGLDLASALQPTLDAIGEALHARVGAARAVDLSLVTADLGSSFSASALVGRTTSAAVLVPDYTLRSALYAPALAAEVEQSPAAAPAFPAAAPAASAASAAASAGDGQQLIGTRGPVRSRGIELLHGVDMEVTVEIGRARMTVRELLDLSPGAVLELDRAAGSPADLLVNGRLIARGEVVVVDEDFGLRITEIVTDAAVG
ncbi:flagellar motor switch protein FliN/FliY [Nocardioides ginsengisegetis]|uniref:Flagellar motor switch protein FliN/FliY n=1 Tax=Nocardioides ginsengisegetis TaxID=661491 RepID=A0A7W3J2E6_9ACTN|nr:flagellar motor switch protein FliN [Nocardioides ginsengisegetis]MBA8805026.1 flagellar motor switch protein FliN/FliY [Nocardioides ginsengisegetis]